jgi:membrane protein implicated in regulation of membrane protease activity
MVRSSEDSVPYRLTEPPFSTYVAAHLPGWTVVVLVAWGLVVIGGVTGWAAMLFVALMIGKDVVSYRTKRRYYTPEPAERRLVDQAAVAVTPLAPRGLVRVRGELWQASVESLDVVPEGALVRVRDVQGLLLIVEPATGPR